jgi:hypothetical protein
MNPTGAKSGELHRCAARAAKRGRTKRFSLTRSAGGREDTKTPPRQKQPHRRCDDHLSEREEVESEVPVSSGDRNAVAAADVPAFDDVGVDADIRLIVLRCGPQDAGIFG